MGIFDDTLAAADQHEGQIDQAIDNFDAFVDDRTGSKFAR